MFQAKDIKTFYGANPYINKKAMVFEIEYDVKKSDLNFKARAQEILDAMPVDFEAFDLKRNNSQTHIISFLLFELLNYVRGNLRYSHFESSSIIIDYHNSKLNLFVFSLICKWFRDANFDVDKFTVDLKTIWGTCKKYHPDFQAHALIEYAKKSNISYHNLDKKIWVYGTGRGSRIFFETSTLEDMKLQRLSKEKCKSIFNDVGVRSPKYVCKSDFENLAEIIDEITFPCVVKPNDAGGGRGVTANINNKNQLEFAIQHAKLHSKNGSIIIEKHLLGCDHRLLIVAGEFKGCVKSETPFVVGDGKQTIRELIDEKNKFRTISFYKSGYKRPIVIDDALTNMLGTQNLKISTVVKLGQKIYLKNNSNLGGGGDSIYVKDVHPEIIEQALQIANHVGLFSTGIDYITDDISKSPEDVDGGFTELNKTPGVPIFANAGFSPEKIGSFFLNRTCWDVPLNFYIVREGMLNIESEFQNSYMYPNIIIKDDMFHRIALSSFEECWSRYVSTNSLDRLEFVISENRLKEFGILEGTDNVFVFNGCSIDTTNFLNACNVKFTTIDQKANN